MRQMKHDKMCIQYRRLIWGHIEISSTQIADFKFPFFFKVVDRHTYRDRDTETDTERQTDRDKVRETQRDRETEA